MGHAVVTGANRGIGLEFCRQLEKRGDQVTAVCRVASPELEGVGVRVLPGVDVSEPKTVDELARRLEGTRIDLLINNAGILVHDDFEHLDFEAIRKQFEVNALGPLRVTRALVPNLAPGSKVVILSSLMGSMADNTSGRMYGYRMSKAAVNAAGVSLARDLEEHGVAVGILHPGYVRTDMTEGRGTSDVREAVEGLLKRIDELSVESSGTLRHSDGRLLPW
jgi:NAD(P)-dependent dehydrogenase (short-subunit alcohol dehydrogenase family)